MSEILFVCSELQRGGAERQWAHLLPGLRDREYVVRLLALRSTGPFYDELAAAGVRVDCAHMRSRMDVRGLREAFALAGRPALVVSQGTNALVVGQAIAFRHRRPHVTIEHTPPGLERKPHRAVLTRAVGRAVDRVVAVSASQLAGLGQLGYVPERITVVRNGVPSLVPGLARADSRSRLGLADDEVGVLLVATLRTQKNVPLFLNAVETAVAREPRIRGFVAGGGPLLEETRALAAERATVVLGERADVPDLISAADVVCLSSHTEAMPMVLLEAMSAGRAVVATDVGGIREIVVDGETGILVPPGDVGRFADSLIRLAGDQAERRSLGEAGRARHAELFSVERMVDGYQALFETELAGH